MSVIGDALLDELEPESFESLLVRVAALRDEQRRLLEDREFYRGESYRHRRTAKKEAA
ncbi:hypothetical protein [Glycomyces tenuis]|uniref:hypothetical protein n=1 Tax=Glycomyces tenuis TaxID=58116 RepID=UPI00042084BA|nr:hypothetical protein [Glycomyces tenuis]